MAGWEHEFDIDERDIDLLRDCLRIWRRTCARYHVEFTYYRDDSCSLAAGRRRYVLGYNSQFSRAPLAVAEFIIEMRAVSTLQYDRRRKRLPLRLMRDVAYVNVPDSVEDQLDPDLVPETAREQVGKSLTRCQVASSAFERCEIDAAEFLEAQHSLITNLALLLGEHAHDRDNFPTLVDKLTTDQELAANLKELGNWRNRVKHRGEYGLAPEVVDEGAEIVWAAARRLTGAYIDPVSSAIREIENDPGAAFRLPPMYTPQGEPRRPVR